MARPPLPRFLLDTSNKTFPRVTYFFFNDREDEKRSAAVALSCLTYQMLSLNDVLLAPLARAFDKTSEKTLRTLSAARRVFTDSARAFGDCFLVVDALDECADKRTMKRGSAKDLGGDHSRCAYRYEDHSRQ